MASREGEERGQSSLPAPSGETAENNGNLQQRLETPPITMPQGAHTPVNASQPQYLGGDQVVLFNMLRAQVEYYFSPQNLGRDSYLRNMLTDAPTKAHHQPPPPPNMALMTPIEVIANFPKVWNICASFGVPEPPPVLLGKALQGSTMVIMSADGAWIGPISQQLPPFAGGGGGVSGSAPPSPSPSHGPPSTVAAGGAPQQFPQQSPYNMAPYPPPQMMMIPMQQPDGTILHQSIPPPYYMGGGPPPPPNNQNSNNNRPLSGSTSPSSASLEDGGSIPSQTKASSKISMVSATSAASLSSLSEQQQQQQQPVQHPMGQAPQQQPPPYGGPMMGQQQQQPPYPMHPQQFLSPPYGVPMQPYPPYYNPQQQQPMHHPMPPPPGVRYGGTPPPPPPPPRGYPPPYPYPGMMPPPPPPPPQYIGDGYPPPHPHGYPPRHQPNVGDNHHRKGGGGESVDGPKKHPDGGGSGYKKKKKNKNNFDKKRGNDSNYGYPSPNNFGQQQQQQQNYGGGGGNASSSSHFNNKYPKQHARKGGDTNNNNEQQKKNGGKEEKAVLNPLDFPGLDGKAATESSTKAATATDERLVGYANAVLKKKENDSAKKMTAAAHTPALPEHEDDNNMAQQTEAMEKEILSEFHDLSIHETDNIIDSKQYDTPAAVDKTDGSHTVETSPSSTENGVVSPLSPTEESSQPIPHGTVNETLTEQKPRVNVKEGDKPAPIPPSGAAVVEQQTLGDDNQFSDTKEQNTEVHKPAAPAAWGSKRLFADVVASQK